VETDSQSTLAVTYKIGETMNEHTCINCGKSSDETPLLNLIFKGVEKYLCSQCLPILIHKPQVVAEKLPGFVPPANPIHEDH
jgi:hypothetical protein